MSAQPDIPDIKFWPTTTVCWTLSIQDVQDLIREYYGEGLEIWNESNEFDPQYLHVRRSDYRTKEQFAQNPGLWPMLEPAVEENVHRIKEWRADGIEGAVGIFDVLFNLAIVKRVIPEGDYLIFD